jgi:hypothetical protein
MSDAPPSAVRRLTRRRFLSGLAVAGGGLAAGAVGLLSLRGTAPAVEGLRVLDAHGYRTFSHLAHAAFPSLRPGGALAGAVDLARAFDGYLADEAPEAQREGQVALTLLELGPVVFERRLATFSHLPHDEAASHFAAWGHSSLALRREVASSLRRFMALLYYDTPAVWASIGYDGPLIPPEPDEATP